MGKQSFEEFAKEIRKLESPKVHRVRNSWGIYDGYKYYRKNKPKAKKYILSESQYFAITRKINDLLVESLLRGEDIKLPHRMGRIELRKFDTYIRFEDGKLKTNLPIDWDATLKLWYEDINSYHNKKLIRREEKELFKIHYNRSKAKYVNKTFYQFNFNNDMKKRLKERIKSGSVDAFTFKNN